MDGEWDCSSDFSLFCRRQDQDAMETDLDKDEIVVARSNEMSGEHLLNSSFLGIMASGGFMVSWVL